MRIAVLCSPLFALALALALALGLAACPSEGPPDPDPDGTNDAGPIDTGPIEVQILGFNDLHGALRPAANGLGGAPVLAAWIDALREERSITVAAGDNHGGSPLAAALFHDEPVIDALNAMGLEFSAVGNHELDEGMPELLRMQNGGCHPIDGCQLTPSFGGAQFRYLAANIIDRETGALVFPPYEIVDIDGVQIAVVGLSTINTAASTVASLLTGFDFVDEASAVNALIPELQERGADAVVVLIHEGGAQAAAAPSINGCESFVGRIGSIASAMDPAVKLVVSGHSHGTYVCRLGDKLVTGAGTTGAVLTDVRLTFDGVTGAFLESSATNVNVDDTFAPDEVVSALVEAAELAAEEGSSQIVGSITADILDAPNASGENVMGLVIADAMLAATTAAPWSAEIAMMNIGGVRASLLFARSGDETADGQVTYGELFSVQPFQNSLVTVSITGRDLHDILRGVGGGGQPFIVSGFTFVVQQSPFAIPPDDILVGGVPLDLEATYRVTTNNILADTVSGFAQLAEGTDQVGAGVDLDALVAYFAAGPVSPPAGRVTLEP